MACSDHNGDFLEAMMQEQFRDAILCPYQENIGGALFAMIIYGAITSHIYIRTESVLIPLVLSILVGGIALTQIPSEGAALITFALLVFGGVVPVLLIRRLIGA